MGKNKEGVGQRECRITGQGERNRDSGIGKKKLEKWNREKEIGKGEMVKRNSGKQKRE